MAEVLGLNPPVPTGNGTLVGRVVTEALKGKSSSVAFTTKTLQSKPAANGLKTVLKYQVLGKTRYFDAAGFPGRTVGLNG